MQALGKIDSMVKNGALRGSVAGGFDSLVVVEGDDDEDFDDPIVPTGENLLFDAPDSPMKKHKINKLLEICMKKKMDLYNEVTSFEEIGLTDPFKPRKSMGDTISLVKTFDFYTEVYPNCVMTQALEALKEKKSIKPPKTVFLPSKQLFRKMIRALVKYGD